MTAEKEKIEKPRKGAALQVIGCVLLFLGLLNTMLSMKGGTEADYLNYIFIICGSVMLLSGIRMSYRG